MKYTIYAITEGRVKMYCYALTSNTEWHNAEGVEKVAEARTVVEAVKIIEDLGGVTLVG